MHHVMCEAQGDRAPEDKERAAEENLQRRNIPQHVHDAQRVRAEHTDQQDGHESETAVNEELSQLRSGQAKEIADGFAISDSFGSGHRENRLVGRTGKEVTDISEERDYREGQQQNAADHSRLSRHHKMLHRFPDVRFLHLDGARGRIRRGIRYFR